MAGRPEAGEGSRRRPPENPTTEADEEEASAGATTGATDGEATAVDENDDDEEEAVASIASTSTRSDATAASASAAAESAAVDGAGTDGDARRARHRFGGTAPGDGGGEGPLGWCRCICRTDQADGWRRRRRRKRRSWAAAPVLAASVAAAAAAAAAAVGVAIVVVVVVTHARMKHLDAGSDNNREPPIPRYDDPSGGAETVVHHPFEPDDERQQRQRDSATRNGAHEAGVHPIRTRSHHTPPTPLQQASTAPPAKLHHKIVNGHPTLSPHVHPHVVSILDSTKAHYCGGTLIAPSWVLTAAHCLYRPSVSSRGFVEVGRWRMGGQYFARGVTTFRIAETYVHPLHDRRRLDYDLALVKLKGEVEEPERFVAYLLDSYGGSTGGDDGGDDNDGGAAGAGASADDPAATRPPEPGEEMVVLGWGSTSYADGGTHLNPGEALRYATVNLVPNRLCAEAYGGSASITRSMMCASDVENGQDACQGDSGGPLVLARDHDVTEEEEEGKETPTRPPDTVAGIVSFGVGCAHPTFPGVYASVPASHGWIVGTVCGEDPGACSTAAAAAGSSTAEEDGAKEKKKRRTIRDFWREAYGAEEEEEEEDKASEEAASAADGGAANDGGAEEAKKEEEDDGEDADGGGLLGQQQQQAHGGTAASDPSPAAEAEAEQQQQPQSAGGGADASPSSGGGGDDDKAAASLVFVLPSPASTSAEASASADGGGGTGTPPTPAAPIEPEPAVEEEEMCGVEHCRDCAAPFEATKSRRKRRRNCRWVGRRKGVRCRLYGDEYCPVTCGRCTPDADDIL